MKNILITLALLIGTILTSAYTNLRHHPVWFYSLIIIIGFLSLAFVTMVLKKILHTIQVSLISTLFICMATIILVVLAHYKVVSLIVGSLTGIVAGFLLAVSLIRNLGKWAQKSVVFGEAFSFITSYRIKSYLDGNKIVPKEEKINTEIDRNNLIEGLKNMGYTKKEAELAADFALDELPASASDEDKAIKALQYFQLPNNHPKQ